MTDHPDLLDLHLAALFTRDEHGNLIATNDPEPDQVAAPRLYLGRSHSRAVLRFRRGLDESTRAALRNLAAPDLTKIDPNREPVNHAAMADLLAAEQPIENIYFGPAFSFPQSATVVDQGWGAGEGEGDPGLGVGVSTSEAAASEIGEPNSTLLRHSREGGNPGPPAVIQVTPPTTHLLRGEFAWLADELTVRGPVMAVSVDGAAVSVCFSARATCHASECGVETLPEHRGRRHAGAVTAAWAAQVRRRGRIPLYSTSWTNHPSRRVAASLGLTQYATDFHIT